MTVQIIIKTIIMMAFILSLIFVCWGKNMYSGRIKSESYCNFDFFSKLIFIIVISIHIGAELF
jgi:hypothetical protein